MSWSSKRKLLISLGSLVPLAGCTLESSDDDESRTRTGMEPSGTPTATASPDETPNPAPTRTVPPTQTNPPTPSPTPVPMESPTSTPAATETPTPVLNETQYQAVQAEVTSSTSVDELEEPRILATSEWRNVLSAEGLADAFVAFLDDTDLESQYVVGFGEWGEWMYGMKLEAVHRESDTVRIDYSHLPGKPPNVRMFKAVFVRLPRDSGVPRTVVSNRTDAPDQTDSG